MTSLKSVGREKMDFRVLLHGPLMHCCMNMFTCYIIWCLTVTSWYITYCWCGVTECVCNNIQMTQCLHIVGMVYSLWLGAHFRSIIWIYWSIQICKLSFSPVVWTVWCILKRKSHSTLTVLQFYNVCIV